MGWADALGKRLGMVKVLGEAFFLCGERVLLWTVW